MLFPELLSRTDSDWISFVLQGQSNPPGGLTLETGRGGGMEERRKGRERRERGLWFILPRTEEQITCRYYANEVRRIGMGMLGGKGTGSSVALPGLKMLLKYT